MLLLQTKFELNEMWGGRGAQRAPKADTKCPQAAQRKRAKHACIYELIAFQIE